MDFTNVFELNDYLQENLNGEVLKVSRGKEIILSIPIEDFDEDTIHDIIPDWNGSYTDDEEKTNYQGEVLVFSGLTVDLDGESLIPFNKYEIDETSDDDWYDDDTEQDNSMWLED